MSFLSTYYLQYIEYSFVYLSIIFSSIFIFAKIINNRISKSRLFILFLLSILVNTITTITKNNSPSISNIVLVFFTFVLLAITEVKPRISSLPIIIISVGITYLARTISIFFVSLIFSALGYQITGILITICILIVHLSLILLLMHLRRLKNGLSFFYNKDNLGIGLIISGFIITAVFLSNQIYITNNILTILMIGSFISSIGLFLWIRKSITEHYRKNLQAKADEHYQNTLAEKEQQIEQLNNSNAFLSKIVHRDNHIMTSLQHTITKYKDCDNPSEKEKLMNEILTLAQERSDLIVKEQNNTKVLPTTGISLIDGALSNMYIKATAHNIDFNLIINQDIHYLINNLITQTDLETLLCDHIKDAIIAINSGEVIKGKILVTITMNDDIYEISIKDNGVDFEVDTLAKLGLERVTTHKDIGGSGIGFMTTFETLKRSNASIIITEHKTKTPFSKSITFRFDGLNAFIINSYRADLLKQLINRNDIIIM